MKRAFTLIELVIVVGILGIIAAIVIPTLQSHTQKVKEATAKDHLRMMRTLIEIYEAKNGVPPGYPDNDISNVPLAEKFREHITISEVAPPNEFRGSMLKFPENPFNNKDAVKIIPDLTDFPAAPEDIDTFGWIYQPATKTVRLNWEGVDSEGISYFDY